MAPHGGQGDIHSLSAEYVIVALVCAWHCKFTAKFRFDTKARTAYYVRLMSARPMLDSMRFARAAESFSGEVKLAELGRLAGSLASDEGQVKFRLQGGIESGRPVLKLNVDTAVMLRCQYCHESYRQELQIEQVLPLARNEAELDRWERNDPLLDALVADPALDVLALVEDEILLSLPVAPRHPGDFCGKAGDQVIARS